MTDLDIDDLYRARAAGGVTPRYARVLLVAAGLFFFSATTSAQGPKPAEIAAVETATPTAKNSPAPVLDGSRDVGASRANDSDSSSKSTSEQEASEKKPAQKASTNQLGESKEGGEKPPLSPQAKLDALKTLLEGKLSTEFELSELFEIDLTQEEQVQSRLGDLKTQKERDEQLKKESPDSSEEGSDASAKKDEKPDSAETTPESPSPGTEPTIAAQILSARLAFLSLAAPDRKKLLDDHRSRKEREKEDAESVEARKRAEQAEVARQQALEDARRARTEAERVVAEEMARLLSIKRKQAEFAQELAHRKTAARTLEESYLSLQRRARAALLSGDENQIISLHRECESFAQETQETFATAISYSPLRAPEVGENRLLDVGLTIDISKVLKLRSSLEAEAKRLNGESREVRWQRRDQLYRALRGTNEQRLALFEALPPERRSEELGLSAAGLSRAAYELRQVVLILRYHVQVTSHWVERVREGHRAGGASTIMTGAVFAQLFVLLWLYLWAKKRLPLLLEAAKDRGSESGSADNSRAGLRVLEVLSDTYRPLLFLAFLWAVHKRLPTAAQNQFEISLIYYAAIWLSSANLLIQLINSVSGRHARSIHLSLATVRLRSLRLVGRTGAYIGLILSLTSQLVGRGTIYHWVIQLTWLLVVPTLLLLCHWWRPLVHAYIEAERRKSPFREWVMRHKTGVVGLLGAGVAGLDLIRVNSMRALRNWADEFVLARRIAAYLFQRELDRRAVEEPSVELLPLPDELFDRLGPSVPSEELGPTTGDEDCKVIHERTRRKRGGIFAVIGERGAGKSSHVRRLAQEHRALVLEGKDTLEELEQVFCLATGEANLTDAVEHIDHSSGYELVIIEGAHQLIRPWIGGIAAFDRLIKEIAPRSHRLTWVLTFEDSVWNFYGGARGTRPTFDDAVYLRSWSEADIRKLLEDRTRHLGLRPDFHLLISALPKDADEIDRMEALEKAKKSLYRLIWDYAAGNPGVALHMWRRSLAVSASGDIYVQLFQAPRAEELEDLPDNAAFVLRAIVQLGDASFDEVIQLTRLNPRLVQDTIRYAHTVGIIEPRKQGYGITWLWYRAVTRFLHRRHLLSIRNLNGARAV